MERKTPHREIETSIRWHKTTVNNVEIMGINKTTPVPPPPVDRHKNHATGHIITRSKSTTTKPTKHEDTRLGKRPLTISSSSTTSRAKPTSTPSMSEKGQSSNSKDDRRLGKRSITISSSSSSSTTNRAKPTPTPSIAEKGQSSNSKNDPRLGKRSITISSSSSSSTINRTKPTSTPSMAEKGSSSNSRDDSRLGKRSITISCPSSSTIRRAKPTLITSSMALKGSSSSNSRDDSRLGKRSITISSPSSSTIRRAKPTLITVSMALKGSSSSNSRDESRFVCELCVESRRSLFSVKGCSHAYCDDCIAKYVTSKVEQNITSIGCPVSACRGKLDPEYCRKILPEHVIDRWGKALCETLIVGAQKFYCPFKDCSALLINDGKKAIRESECPHCHRLFCAQCMVPWHSEIDCAEFQKLNKNEREREDIMLMKLAQNKKWQRCPNCKYYVEKKEGCMYMYCRCRTAFCYNCGNVADALNHTFHYCSICKR